MNAEILLQDSFLALKDESSLDYELFVKPIFFLL